MKRKKDAKKIRIVVLGAVGAMAIECTRDLVQTAEFDQVVLADIDLNRLQQITEELQDPRVSVLKIDARQKDELAAVMNGCDLFINGMPSDFSANVSEVAIQLGLSGTDITGLADMFDFDALAAEKDSLIVAGLGCTPGITNVLARYGSNRLDRVEEINIYFAAWRSIAMSPALVDFTVWALRPDNSDRCYYEDGSFVSVEPFSGRRTVEFMDPIGEQEVYYLPHQETITIPRFLNCRKVATLGTYPPEDMELFRYLWQYGFLGDQPVEGTDLSPLEFVQRHLRQAPEAARQDRLHYALVVEVAGEAGGRQVTHRLAASHPPMDRWGGPRVYAKFAGIPLSVGSQLLAKGQVEGKGVLAPEACMPPEEFILGLKKRGFLFDFRVVEGSHATKD